MTPNTYSPPHNLNALLIGTGEFSFALGATTPAQAAALGMRDFGNIKAFQVDAGGDDKEHYGSYRGTTRRDDLRKQKLKIGYKLTCDEWNANTLKYMFFATPSGPLTRAAVAAVAGTAIPFSNAAPSNVNFHYDVLDAQGNRVRDLTAVTFAGLQENTDFVVDYIMGRVRFLAVHTAPLAPTITAAAIVAGDVNSLNQITPMAQSLFQGIGRITIFDEDDNQQVVFEHTDFSCEVEITGTADVKNDDYSDMSMMVSITGLVGNVLVRES